MSKKIQTLALAVFVFCFAFGIFSCQEVTPPEKVYTIHQAIGAPEQFTRERYAYVNGVVVYKSQKKGKTAVAVVGKPFPNVKTVNDLADHQVLIVKLGQTEYDAVDIGTIISMRGLMKRAEKNGKVVYYIDAYNVYATGQEAIQDPDFEKLVEVVDYKIKRDKDMEEFWNMYFFFFIVLPAVL